MKALCFLIGLALIISSAMFGITGLYGFATIVSPTQVNDDLAASILALLFLFSCCVILGWSGIKLLKHCHNVSTHVISAQQQMKTDPSPVIHQPPLVPEAPPNYHDTCIASIDHMEGHQFEAYCATLLQKVDFTNVRVTPGSGDQGVDILAEKEGIRYAIQCKNYSSKLGNTSVQEVNAGKIFYNCHVAVVMTNSSFTSGAVELAKATNVLLWDRNELLRLISLSAKKEAGQC